jgi:hypothetical protein
VCLVVADEHAAHRYAQNSRNKKKVVTEQVESSMDSLKSTNDALRAKIAALEQRVNVAISLSASFGEAGRQLVDVRCARVVLSRGACSHVCALRARTCRCWQAATALTMLARVPLSDVVAAPTASLVVSCCSSWYGGVCWRLSSLLTLRVSYFHLD